MPARLLLAWFFCCLASAAPLLRAQPLPPEIEAALDRARLPRDAVTVLVQPLDGNARPRVAHRVDAPVNPASLAKLVTTFAGLELLGPAYTWTTPVHFGGPVRDGTLHGHLHIQGRGDPKLVVEKLWLLLRRVQAAGVRQIAGDIVLDRSAFETITTDPGAFDGEPLRPYNATPDALLLNFKSVVLTFVPEGSQARLQVEPPLAGVQWPTLVPIVPRECSDWRVALAPDFSDPQRPRFAGAYPGACAEGSWPIAYPDPASYAARLVAATWQSLGGQLTGRVREGAAPAGAKPAFEFASPPLAEAIRDINKFSNNVMAQQLFLTLSLQSRGTGTMEGSREALRTWWRQRFGEPVPSIENGSGLSRSDRMTARQLGQLLQVAWASSLMPEFVASLPLAGVDGTLRRSRSAPIAHLKTGSLRDVQGYAGYVHAPSGRRYALVVIANHPNAGALRGIADVLVEWTARGG